MYYAAFLLAACYGIVLGASVMTAVICLGGFHLPRYSLRALLILSVLLAVLAAQWPHLKTALDFDAHVNPEADAVAQSAMRRVITVFGSVFLVVVFWAGYSAHKDRVRRLSENS